jgi:Protein of unknown function (DUF1553)/Protein of unknown function (DUF1549)
MVRLLPHWGPGLVVLVALIAPPIASAQAGKKSGKPADPNDLASYDKLITASDRAHWAYQPVQRPAVPKVRASDWVINPIDAFILANLEAEGLRPSPAAEPRALLRRVHLDLTGLPPTLGEQERFLADPSPVALRKIVDELLARPTYGERWARHWLDLVRYADTNGYERDADRPSVWRYRDYVIRAFNDDKPFDRFVLEQLAGDELPNATGETLIATTYYRLGPWDDEPADPQEDRFDQLDDMVATTSQVFLGLTLACARCHNHKFDALTQHDYYRMVAIFSPLQRPTRGRQELDLPAASAQELGHAAERCRTLAALQVSSLTARRARSPGAIALDLAVRRACAELPELQRGYFMQEKSPNAPATHILLRGKAARPGPKVEPGVPAVLVSTQPAFPPPTKTTSLRRLTLARWIAGRDNPLTVRVLVNRVWQFHFGEGLVRTPSDFGVMGQPPTHPALLDWLADRFVEDGWSLKKLHRLIMSSSTYRMSKRWDKIAAPIDPGDRLLWRFPYRRLEAEAIRDSILAVSGTLNPKMYGPSMYPYVPREALAGSSDPNQIWKPFVEAEASRRTIYAFSKRSLAVPLLEVLDVPESSRSCDKRLVTTVAPQALSLFNGDFVNRQAKHFAGRLIDEVGADPGKQIERAYRLALCRPPTPQERVLMGEFLRKEGGDRRALEQMCRVIFNLNEFVYAD